MTPRKLTKSDLVANLKRLSEIAKWFDDREEVNIEEGLVKVKEAASLVGETKKRLGEVENEFKEIKKNLEVGKIEK